MSRWPLSSGCVLRAGGFLFFQLDGHVGAPRQLHPEPATHGAAVLDGTISGVDHLHPKNRGIIQMKIPEGGALKTVIEKVVPLYIPVGPSGCFRYGANVIPSHGPWFPTRAGST